MPVSSSRLILDPIRDMSYEELTLFFAIYDCLFRIDENGMVHKNLASNLQSSEYYKEYKIEINRNAKFHDGAKLRAEDVKTSIETTIKKIGTSSDTLKNIIEIQCVDERTLIFKLPKSDPDFPRKLAHPYFAIVKGDVKTKSSGTLIVTHFTGTGAFQITDVSRKGTIRLERYIDYHRGKSYLDKVEFTLIPKTDESYIEFLAGNLDIHRVSYERYRGLKTRPTAQLHERDGWDTLILDTENHSNRTSLIKTIDPEGLVRVTMNSAADEISGIFPDDEKRFIPLNLYTQTEQIRGNITLGYYGDRMFLEPVAQSIAAKWESKGAVVSIIKLDELDKPNTDVTLRIVKTLGQDSAFLWGCLRDDFGFRNEMTESEEFVVLAEEIEQEKAIAQGKFYPVARLKMAFAVNEKVNDFRLMANCVPDFWAMNIK